MILSYFFISSFRREESSMQRQVVSKTGAGSLLIYRAIMNIHSTNKNIKGLNMKIHIAAWSANTSNFEVQSKDYAKFIDKSTLTQEYMIYYISFRNMSLN